MVNPRTLKGCDNVMRGVVALFQSANRLHPQPGAARLRRLPRAMVSHPFGVKTNMRRYRCPTLTKSSCGDEWPGSCRRCSFLPASLTFMVSTVSRPSHRLAGKPVPLSRKRVGASQTRQSKDATGNSSLAISSVICGTAPVRPAQVRSFVSGFRIRGTSPSPRPSATGLRLALSPQSSERVQPGEGRVVRA